MSPEADQGRSGRALDAANFFLADVRDGLGPYLAIYLLTEQHWNEARIGVVMSIVVDLMRNTGRFNVAQGAVITAQSIGAALSTSLAGIVVVKAGYSAAFLTLGAVAAFGLLICAFALPETRGNADPASSPSGGHADLPEIKNADRAA